MHGFVVGVVHCGPFPFNRVKPFGEYISEKHPYHFDLFDAWFLFDVIISDSFSFISLGRTASKWCCGVFISFRNFDITFSHTQHTHTHTDKQQNNGKTFECIYYKTSM